MKPVQHQNRFFLVFKTKPISKIWDYTYFPRLNELICKNSACIIYCKHCLLESSYDFPVVINFYKYLVAKYGIVIEKRQNLTLAEVSDEFDRLYKRLCKNDQIEKVETKILEKVLY